MIRDQEKNGRDDELAVSSFSLTSPVGVHPVEVLEREHKLHEQICDSLERIADSLPDEVDRSLCATMVVALRFDLPLHHRDEEEGLFPLLRARATKEDGVTGMLGQLSREHSIDESSADELVDFLQALSKGRRADNPNMFGYMLRGFFESYRRHIQWENKVILPMSRRLLTDEDLASLTRLMIKNRMRANSNRHQR